MKTEGARPEIFIPPIAIPSILVDRLYRFTDNIDQVNWKSKREPELPYARSLVDDICNFLDINIRKITYNPSDLRAIIGVSGIDSAVSAWLAAETMRRAKNLDTACETSLIIANFRAMNLADEEYGKSCYQELIQAYPDLNIYFIWSDMTNIIKEIDDVTENVVSITGVSKMWPAEPATGVIDIATVSMGFKHWAAALDSTNKTEEVLGEINIPSGCAIKILANLWKSQVYDLGEILGIPETILNKKPINSTYGTSKVDSYFAEMPGDITPRHAYQILDLVLEKLFDEGKSPDEIATLLGHSNTFINRLKIKIDSQEHRRKIPTYSPLRRL